MHDVVPSLVLALPPAFHSQLERYRMSLIKVADLREPVEIAIRGGRSMTTRREFLDGAVGAAGLAISSTAKSYAQIIGSNNRLNFAVIGLNGRAYAHLSSLKANKANARISHVCD